MQPPSALVDERLMSNPSERLDRPTAFELPAWTPLSHFESLVARTLFAQESNGYGSARFPAWCPSGRAMVEEGYVVTVFEAKGGAYSNAPELVFVQPRTDHYQFLAREFNVSAGLLRSIGHAISAHLRQYRHLRMSVERLVDHETGQRLEIIFEIRGARSLEELSRVWDEIGALVRQVPRTEQDRISLVEKIAVHVHLGSP